MDITDGELLAYLDEQLPVEQAARIERELRSSSILRQQAALLVRRQDQGGHTVGEIWRRQRLSCLSRSQLGGYLLGTASSELADYIEFHLRTIGCRVCDANLHDLRESSRATPETARRRRKFFESSAGRLSPSR
ncbi:MAG: hypothetical protein AB7U20_23985 [Planctomycetaceae bacterium]